MKEKKCLFCKKLLKRNNRISFKEWNRRKFCNRICYYKYTRGKNTYQWKGGITKLNTAIRKDIKYINWRSRCFKRDKYTCQITGKKGLLVVHHIKKLSTLINKKNIKNIEQARKYKYLWNIKNGITMLESIHKLFHKYYKNSNNKKDILEFKNKLCKKCKSDIRTTLTMCESCRKKHNSNTVKLKRKYRKNKLCCMCGQPSVNRRCKICSEKNTKYVKNSLFIQAKKSKKGIFNTIKQISKVI